ncbi:MAG: hypothetical protein O3A20_02360 [Planctomycetota bacterium]|nr:hypothetical protein [Planctomycetota bacterium]
MNPARLWLRRLLPVGLTVGLMAAGNAVNAYSASDGGMAICHARAVASSGQEELSVRDYSFHRGFFSQAMQVSFVTGWNDPDAEVTIQITRPVFFLPWRIETEQTRVQPDRLISL